MPPPPLQTTRRLARWYRASLVGHPDGQDFRRLWAGDSISQLGTGVGEIAVALLAVGVLGTGAFEMGVLGAVEKAAFLLIGLPAGAWVDRMRKRRVLVAGDVVRGVALLALPVAWLTGTLSLPLLLVVVGVTGVATVFFDVAYQSYLPSLVAEDRISEGNAKLQISYSTAEVLGPALGGLLVRVLGAPLTIGLNALSFLGSVGFALAIRHREVAAPVSERRPLRVEIGEGLSFVLHQPLLRRIVATTGGSNFFGSASGALLVLYAVHDLGLSASDLGLVLGGGALGGLVGALLVGAVMRWIGEGPAIAYPLLLGVPAAVLLPLADGRGRVTEMVLLTVSGVLLSIAVVVYNVAQVSFRQRLCPRPLLGRMNASVRFIVWGTAPLGALAGGAAAGTIGIVATLWVIVGGLALALLPVLLSPLARTRDPLVASAGQEPGTAPR